MDGIMRHEGADMAGNVIDDIRSDLDRFDARPFGQTDSLALSQLAYARMPDNVPRLDGSGDAHALATVPLRDLLRAECYDDMFGSIWSPSLNVDLLRAMCESPRWRDLRVGGYVSEFDPSQTKQFSACVFDVGDGSLYVAFRGTDATIVGWKEDFMMAFRRPISSQVAAADYLIRIASLWHGPIRVGGHSKGGNLAVYAAASVDESIRERIVWAYSHDGPGFDEEFLASAGYLDIAAKVDKSVPSSSIIGMLFEPRERMADGYTVVDSDGVGIMQHFALNWHVEHGRFAASEGLSASARYAARTLNEWMARYDDDRRRVFIENLFRVIESAGCDTFGALTSHWTQSLPAMLAAARDIDADDRKVMTTVIAGLASAAAASVVAS
ncbi:DUF2974 domain-containing protein [Bifidobacterium jacchi]|nr:DUF2974 domain-containing protein [Bifidobacterium jacchi]